MSTSSATGSSSSDDNDSAATSVLLPVATRDEVELAIGRVLPGFDLHRIELHPSPRRARWVRWFDFWTLRYGWDDRALITEHGWLTHVRDIVPHAKTQSVGITQGPLQRRLRLADVHVHTTKGPVNVVAQELDADARPANSRSASSTGPGPPALPIGSALRRPQAADAEPERAAREQARRSAQESGWSEQPQSESDGAEQPALSGEDALLASFGTARERLIGSGGESEVFALDEQRVLRLYRSRHEAPLRVGHPTPRALPGTGTGVDVGIEVPSILDVGQRDGRIFTVDRRFSGRNFSALAAWSRPRGTTGRAADLPRCRPAGAAAAESGAGLRAPGRRRRRRGSTGRSGSCCTPCWPGRSSRAVPNYSRICRTSPASGSGCTSM